jgi:archaellum biogenesis ATPase FlaH
MTKLSASELDSIKGDPNVPRLYSSRVGLSRQGNRLMGCCPFHSDKTPSFSINQKNGQWLYGCFGCGVSGNIFQFIEEIDHVTFEEAVSVVSEFLGRIKPKTSWQQAKTAVEQVFHPLGGKKEFKTYKIEDLRPLEEALAKSKEVQEWLSSRGIRLGIAQAAHLGFKQHLTMADLKGSDIAKRGWIVFPSIDGGTVTGMKYRSIVEKTFYRQKGMATGLFGVQFIDMLEPLYVVEGEPDALVLQQAGYHAVSLPSASITPTPEMRDQLMQASRVILAGDCDGGVGEDIMQKLWQELGERAFLLKWPDGKKDANEVWHHVGHDTTKFRDLVEVLTLEGMAKPAPYVTSLVQAMTTSQQLNLKDSPNRFHWPWPKVDDMAILLPGSVIGVMATNTGMGKTTLVHQAALYGARKHSEVVLCYQAEMSVAEMVTLTAAHLLRKHRNHLTPEDMQKAQSLISGVRYYIGRNPDLATIDPVLDLIESSIRRLGATVAILDNLHFLCRNEDNEIQAQANAMQRIKRMAQQYGTKFIVIGQPRKAKQDTRGKQIHLTDWRGSATGVDDADALFVLHREWLKNVDPENPPMDKYDPMTTITREKARACGDGPACAPLVFLGAQATFSEMSNEPEYAPVGSQETLGVRENSSS